MEKDKKHVKVSKAFHKELKRRAIEKETTIEKEMDDILKNSLLGD